MKWPLISDKSSQQTTRQKEKSQLTQGGETRWDHRATTSAALHTTSADSQCLAIAKQMNILLILTLIGLVFGFILPELNGFDNEIIDLNIEFKSEKNGLNNDCDVSSSPTSNTIGAPSFNLSQTGVGLAEFNNLGCDFNSVSAPTATATVTVTIVPNKNKNKNIFESCPLWGHNKETTHHTPHSNAPRMDRFCEFDNIDCIFDNSMDGIGLQYDITFGMCIIFSLFFMFFFFSFVCQFTRLPTGFLVFY